LPPLANPERTHTAAARRLPTSLSPFGPGVDPVIANRLLPDAATDPCFKAWKDTHAEHLTAIEEGFAPLPVLKAELAPEELVGVERLRRFGEILYASADPAALLHQGEPLRVERRG